MGSVAAATKGADPSLAPGEPPCQRSLRLARPSAWRSIAALMLREMSTRFGRTPGGYVWILLQPLGMIILLAVAFSMLQRHPALGTSFLLFKSTGYLVLTIFRTIAQHTGLSLQFSRALLAYPGVTWIDAVLARFLLNTLAGVIVTTLILTGIILYEGHILILNWPAILTALGLSILLGLGIGCLNCVLFLRFDVWTQLWAILTAPLFVISGVLILYEDLPELAQRILWYNPIYHITGLMRAGFYVSYTPSYISVAYVLVWGLVPMVLGLMLLRRFHRTLLNR